MSSHGRSAISQVGSVSVDEATVGNRDVESRRVKGDKIARILAESLGIGQQVIFAGHVAWDQTPAHRGLADLLVQPSILDQAGNVDGLPNVLLESMASGCATVAIDVAGVPDAITGVKMGFSYLKGM